MVRRVFVFVMFAVLVGWWIVRPLAYRGESTSRSVTVQKLAEPFLTSGALVYRWGGDVWRSCAIEVRRTVIDSDGVLTNLVPVSFARIPFSDLGWQFYEVTVQVPSQIAEGPAIYQAYEISSCDWLQSLFPKPVPYPPVRFTVTR